MSQRGAVDEASPKLNKSNSSCCVPHCNKPGYVLENGEKVTFHKLPKKGEMLDTWIVKMRRDVGENFIISNHTKICSRHFEASDFIIRPKSGDRVIKPDAVPTIFAWSTPKTPRRSIVKHGMVESPESSPLKDITNSQNDEHDLTLATAIPQSPHGGIKDRIAALERQLAVAQGKNSRYQKENDGLRNHIKNQSSKDKDDYTEFCLDKFKDNNEDIAFYTGFPNCVVLKACLKYLNPGVYGENIIYCDAKGPIKKITRPKKLKIEDEFFLTLVRLRLGLFEHDLAHRFHISIASVNRIILSWINFMYLRLGNLNIWPSTEAVKATMPESMKEKYPETDWIIDAFEIQTERPSSLYLQSQSYSSYKSRNTVKGLIACTPSGQIGFVSHLYTGNISDRELTIRSGFLGMPHRRGSMWLVDKGFQIGDLAQPLGVTINMPEFVGKDSQMSQKAVFHTQQIASERIHVERIINKVKNFHIFDRPIAMNTFGTVNQMWTVCALLTLFQNPIISA